MKALASLGVDGISDGTAPSASPPIQIGTAWTAIRSDAFCRFYYRWL